MMEFRTIEDHPSTLGRRGRYLERLLGVPFTQGNEVRFLRNGDEIFPAMLEAIAEAEASIEFLTFVYWEGSIADRFARALADKAREGVVVRVLLDSYGAAKMRSDLVEEMRGAGVQVCWFRPFSTWRLWKFDNRTHRKVLVCDNRVAFTGGVGIAAEWEGNARGPGEWRETHVEIRGPAVEGVAGAFWENWLEMRPMDLPTVSTTAKGQPMLGEDSLMVVRSTARDNGSDASVLFQGAFHLAEREVIIATPYFVIEEQMRNRLCDTASRGVKVTILIPGPHLDKRFEWFAARQDFEALMEAGVKIYRYDRTMLHMKLVLIDDDLSMIGSTNLNQRSMRRDAEVMLVMSGEKRNQELRADFQRDLEDATLQSEAAFADRSWSKRLCEAVMVPFRGQL